MNNDKFKPLSNDVYRNRLPSDFSSDSTGCCSSSKDIAIQQHKTIQQKRKPTTTTIKQLSLNISSLIKPCHVIIEKISDPKLRLLSPQIKLIRCDIALINNDDKINVINIDNDENNDDGKMIIDENNDIICGNRIIRNKCEQYYGDKIIIESSSEDDEPLVKSRKYQKLYDNEWMPYKKSSLKLKPQHNYDSIVIDSSSQSSVESFTKNSIQGKLNFILFFRLYFVFS